MAHPEARLSVAEEGDIERAVQRLEAGEPLPYVIGHWEFYGLDFTLTSQVLIPRPDTELLVERGLKWLRAHPGRRLACDVGTGSGCIAVALASNTPDLTVVASDLAREALQVARLNAQRHGVQGRVHCLQADLIPSTGKPFDLVCANLPYIPSETLRTLDIYPREPALALDGGMDGLELIRRLLQMAPGHIAPGGALLLEIEALEGQTAIDLGRESFPEADIHLHADLSGYDRVVQIGLPD
jgi:release factor glutamine methyltransferase